MISAEILADSKNQFGDRLTTFKVTFPRIILAELNTHRMFSRNSASSRAIPFEKMVESVEKNPFVPIAWQKDHKGMQGTEYYYDSHILEDIWLEARDEAIKAATSLNTGIYKNNMSYKGESDYGHRVTKQLCNRLLEPFMWHTVIITSGSEGLENFFKLRCPQYVSSTGETYRSKKDWITDNAYNVEPDSLPNIDNVVGWLNLNKGQSEIHMMALAEAMWDVYNESNPKELKEGEWHIPFGDNINEDKLEDVLRGPYRASYIRHDGDTEQAKVEIAVAHCARVSYTTFGEDKTDNYEADIKLYDRLLQSGHYSPFEHVARVMTKDEYQSFYRGEGANEEHVGRKKNRGWCLNFRGFIQQRYLIENV